MHLVCVTSDHCVQPTFSIPSGNGSYNLIISVYYCLVDNIMCGNWQGNVMALFSFALTIYFYSKLKR